MRSVRFDLFPLWYGCDLPYKKNAPHRWWGIQEPCAAYAACCWIALRTFERVLSSMDKLCASRPCCSILGRISSSLFPLTCQVQVLGPTSEQRNLSFWFPWPVLRSDDGALDRSCAILIFLLCSFSLSNRARCNEIESCRSGEMCAAHARQEQFKTKLPSFIFYLYIFGFFILSLNPAVLSVRERFETR